MQSTSAVTEQALYGHIDRLRGVFAIAVMLGHVIDLAYGAGTPDGSFTLLMTVRPMLGFVWVVGFIIISGYCVTRSCLRMPTQSVLGFAALRASRLFPLLWVSLALAVLVETAVAGSPFRPAVWTAGLDQRHIVINALGLGGFYGQYGALAPAYTLSYELVFYALWAVAWFGSKRRPTLAMLACVALAATFYLGRDYLTYQAQIPFNDFVLLLFLCWCVGAAMALWLRDLSATTAARWLAPFRWIVLIAIIWIGSAHFQMPALQATRVSVWYYPILSLGFALLTIGFAARPSATPASALDRWLGALSYPLFITHGPVIIGLSTLYRSRALAIGFGLYILALAVPTVIMGWLFAVLVDGPVMALRHRMRRSGTAPVVVPMVAPLS